jgi:hypothetical protein
MMRNWLNLTIYIQGTVDFSYFKDIPNSAQIVTRGINGGGGYDDEKDPNSTTLNVYR